MQLIDSHAHLTFDDVSSVDEVIKRARDNHISKIINICTDSKSLEEGLLLSKKYDFIYNTAATTPHDVEKQGKEFFPIVEKHAKEKNIIAIGETGLDYYYQHSKKETQKKYLEKYFNLSIDTKLPIIIHCRDAFLDLFDMADNIYKDRSLLLHCFTGSVEEAKNALDRNYYISFSGIITFKKATELQEVVKYVPLENILIETDSPFLTPNSKRGKRNEPSYLLEIAQKLALIKNLSLEEVLKNTVNNTRAYFNIFS